MIPTFKGYQREKLRVPDNGVGLILLQRHKVLDKIIAQIKTADNLYFRGCKGSGKSLIMTLLAERLMKEGHIVHVFDAGVLAKITRPQMIHYSESLEAEGKKSLFFD
jgi:predicted AAA+ superfamily ATPase